MYHCDLPYGHIICIDVKGAFDTVIAALRIVHRNQLQLNVLPNQSTYSPMPNVT